jgi:cytochrome c5
MSDEHTSPIKSPKQLAIVVALAFAVPIALIVLLSQLVTGIKPAGSSEAQDAVLTRIKPVGEVTLGDANTPASGPTVAAAGAAAPAAGAKLDGKHVYDTVCTACHAAGVAGAPKFGDKAAWAPRLKTGMNALYTAALNGMGAMPPRGGSQLSDAEIKAGVDYMAAAAK